jgi:hypothetical protein
VVGSSPEQRILDALGLEGTEAIVPPDETADLLPEAHLRLDPAERRLLATMPLHAITSVHGEADLRERLLMEIAQFPVAERARIGDALAGIPAARAGPAAARTLRKSPASYHPHPEPLPGHDPDVACAALLHDAVEDHAADLAADDTAQAAVAALAGWFGDRTAELVAAVTNPAWEPGRDEHEQYREHVTASLTASPWARVIKASDYTDNAVGLIHTTGPKLSRLARKYGPLTPTLRELILRPDTPLDADVKNMIARQLGNAQGRFAAIWHGHAADNDTGQTSAARPSCS